MNIYILEDDLMQQTRISDIIRELVSEGAFSVRKLEVFSKPHKLLSSINEKGNHQIFLLDIDIDGNRKKGLEVASEIRQQDANAVIIFVTTHSEFAPISFKYKVSALDFIEKTVSNVEFKQQLKQTLTFVNQKLEMWTMMRCLCLKLLSLEYKFRCEIFIILRQLQLLIR